MKRKVVKKNYQYIENIEFDLCDKLTSEALVNMILLRDGYEYMQESEEWTELGTEWGR